MIPAVSATSQKNADPGSGRDRVAAMHEVMGAILAGGQSLRMGHDKAVLPMRDGRSMIEHVADALRAACSNDQIVVVGGAAIQARGWLHIDDQRPSAGPLGGIEAILASGLAREYLVCPCDIPAITSDVLRFALQKREAMATVLRVMGREHFEPLPARMAALALPVVRRLLDSGARSVWRLMEGLPAAIVEIDAGRGDALRNINTPEEFDALHQQSHGRGSGF